MGNSSLQRQTDPDHWSSKMRCSVTDLDFRSFLIVLLVGNENCWRWLRVPQMLELKTSLTPCTILNFKTRGSLIPLSERAKWENSQICWMSELSWEGLSMFKIYNHARRLGLGKRHHPSWAPNPIRPSLHDISSNALIANMSKTVNISTPAQFEGLLKSSRIVVTDCKLCPLLPRYSCKCFACLLSGYGIYFRASLMLIDSLCNMVWPLQGGCACLRTIVSSVVASKSDYFCEGWCGPTEGDCTKI